VRRREFLLAAASLALAPRTAFAAARRPFALVTADVEAHVAVVDLEHLRVVARIPTVAGPRSIERVGETAVVAHSEHGAVSLLHGRLDRPRVLRGFGEPRYTAGHPSGRIAYVTDAERGEIVALDVLRGRRIASAKVGARARHVALSRHGRTLWIALGSRATEMAVVDVADPAQPRLVRRFATPFAAHDVAFAPDGNAVWVSSGDSNELVVYERRTGRTLARPAADLPPQHITFRRGRAYVTSGDSGTLRVHDLSGHPLRMTRVPEGSYNVQQADGWVVTPALGGGSLCILDARGRLLRREQVARSSHDACIFAAGP
jgi:hypothetical protein